jgi:hypothetical protein
MGKIFPEGNFLLKDGPSFLFFCFSPRVFKLARLLIHKVNMTGEELKK